MSAHVARLNPHRLRDKENPTVQMEWVKRELALLVECEWDWTTEREAAFCFADYGAAERWIVEVRGAERERGEDRFYGAYAVGAAFNIQHPTSNVQHPSSDSAGDGREADEDGEISPASGGVESRHADTGRAMASRTPGEDGQIAITPSRGSVRPARTESLEGLSPRREKGTITERIQTARRNRKVAAERREAADAPAPEGAGASAWREVYRARVAPEDVYERTERRCGS